MNNELRLVEKDGILCTFKDINNHLYKVEIYNVDVENESILKVSDNLLEEIKNNNVAFGMLPSVYGRDIMKLDSSQIKDEVVTLTTKDLNIYLKRLYG